MSNLSDLEGLTRNLIKKGYSKQQILERLVKEYKDFKNIDKDYIVFYTINDLINYVI